MTFWKRAGNYADDILSEKIPACEHVKAACRRFRAVCNRKDLVAHEDGNRWCRFLEKLPHVKGKWAAKHEKFRLSDWKIFCTVNIYGWKWKSTGRRRFTEAYIEVPRGNGKSYWLAGLGIGHLTIDGESGAEIYCGASTEKQAHEVFTPAKRICEQYPDLREKYGIEVNAKSLVVLSTGGKFEPVIGKPGDGPAPSCAIVDEYHEHIDSDQLDSFKTGMGKREQALMLVITTAGVDMGGPCYSLRDDMLKIL